MFKNFKANLKYLIAAAMACVAVAAYALQEIPVAAVTNVAGTFDSADMYARDNPNGAKDVGIHVLPVITAVTGSATMTLTVQGKNPQGTYYDVLVSVPTQATTTMTAGDLFVGAGYPAVANVASGRGLPPVFRVRHSITGSGSATYSIGVNRITN